MQSQSLPDDVAYPRPQAMRADRGYDSGCFRQALVIHGILPVTPSRKGSKVPQQTDWQRYQDRNRVERMFNRLKQMRRIAIRYDKTALSFTSFLYLAAVRHWIRSFVSVDYKKSIFLLS
ncbi:transposase [Asaia lannensis]|uniref:Transposase n=1 Tax=Asaia lannensis NBRC 102526 TaxID=1307926 RepID=A0ABT1CDP9_9PROT|nr:transposase [Asaia lannensis]MCO6158995.1 transposase [Asaia lannensis NBRC 102526]